MALTGRAEAGGPAHGARSAPLRRPCGLAIVHVIDARWRWASVRFTFVELWEWPRSGINRAAHDLPADWGGLPSSNLDSFVQRQSPPQSAVSTWQPASAIEACGRTRRLDGSIAAEGGTLQPTSPAVPSRLHARHHCPTCTTGLRASMMTSKPEGGCSSPGTPLLDQIWQPRPDGSPRARQALASRRGLTRASLSRNRAPQGRHGGEVMRRRPGPSRGRPAWRRERGRRGSGSGPRSTAPLGSRPAGTSRARRPRPGWRRVWRR